MIFVSIALGVPSNMLNRTYGTILRGARFHPAVCPEHEDRPWLNF